MVGGLVVGALSGSSLMVSGPAAGLTPIVLLGIQQVGGFERLLPAVVLAGGLQLLLSAARAGTVAYYVPSSVIKGMLAGIGITLILKQVPHAVGYDSDAEGDLSFVESSGETTLSTLAAVAAADSDWRRDRGARRRGGDAVVAALTVRPRPAAAGAAAGGGCRGRHQRAVPGLAARAGGARHAPGVAAHDSSSGAIASHLVLPDWSALSTPVVWQLGIIIALVASLESLLNLEATRKLDPLRRDASMNRELMAQGAGNMLAGLLGGLPLTGVMIRSSANVDAGARSRLSVMVHAALMLVAVLAFGAVLNRIPLAAIASVLLVTGFRLAAPSLWQNAWHLGYSHFIPFAVTIVAIVFTDLLRGLAIGFATGVAFIVIEHLRSPVLTRVSPPGAVLTRYLLPEQVTFLSKASISRALNTFKPGTRVEIDGRKTTRFDHDALEVLHIFRETARLRGIDYRLVGIPETELTPTHDRDSL